MYLNIRTMQQTQIVISLCIFKILIFFLNFVPFCYALTEPDVVLCVLRRVRFERSETFLQPFLPAKQQNKKTNKTARRCKKAEIQSISIKSILQKSLQQNKIILLQALFIGENNIYKIE